MGTHAFLWGVAGRATLGSLFLTTGCTAETRDGNDSGDSITGGSGDGSGSPADDGGGSEGDGDDATGGSAGTDGGDGTSSRDGGDGDGDGDGGIRLDVGAGDTGGGAEGGASEGCKFLDIVFVIDISWSMREEQANLAANFPEFVRVLDEYVADPNKGAEGYRLGVTNSTIVQNGADRISLSGLDGQLAGPGTSGESCGIGANPWIDGPDPTVVDKFTCLADNPISGCRSCSDQGNERPLDAMERFVDLHAPGQPNEGFYRGSDSLLVLVNLTDEDDDPQYTTTTPDATKLKLDTFAGGAERYVAVTIAGPRTGSCSSAFGNAFAAPVLHEFTDSVPNGVMGDICLGDLAQPLADALDLIEISCDTLPPVG